MPRRTWPASLLLLAAFVAVWHLLTSSGSGAPSAIDPEYARLAGQSAGAGPTAAIPTPGAVARRAYELLANAFDRSNPNNIGIAFEHVTRIVLPASVPMIMTGMRVSIGIAWFVIVAAEMVGAQSGIGYFIWNEWNNLQIASMIVAIVLIGLVGLGLDIGLSWIGQRLSFRE